MQKKMHQQCHCEGAVGDCGKLKPHNTKTVYFLRRPLKAANLLFRAENKGVEQNCVNFQENGKI